jgi:hypothetical protein
LGTATPRVRSRFRFFLGFRILTSRSAIQLEDRFESAFDHFVLHSVLFVLAAPELTFGLNTSFPAPTRSGHIEKSSLKKPHHKAGDLAKVQPFTLYTLRHTCLTCWTAPMDPYTLAHLAGNSDFSTTKRYVHPQEETVLAAMDRAREALGSHSFSHSGEKDSPTANSQAEEKSFELRGMKWSGREDSNLRPTGPEPEESNYDEN